SRTHPIVACDDRRARPTGAQVAGPRQLSFLSTPAAHAAAAPLAFAGDGIVEFGGRVLVPSPGHILRRTPDASRDRRRTATCHIAPDLPRRKHENPLI